MTLKLTISIPTWNRLAFLKENVLAIIAAIETVPAGTVELFVSDNASTDGTADFLAEMGQRYPFIRYVTQPFNQGANANFHTVLKEAHGAYVWLLGDDDKINEQSLTRILADIDTYKPAVIIGGTEHDVSGQRVYLTKIKNHVLTDRSILLDYDGFALAGKMSVLIFEKAALDRVLEAGWVIIQATSTPWPHLVWFLKILAQHQSLLILPYATNYIVEKNRYNLLQSGVMRIELMFIDYTRMVETVLPEFDRPIQESLKRRIVDGRVMELIKILAYATYLNGYAETLSSALLALKAIPLRRSRFKFVCGYLLPALLPIRLRHGGFSLLGWLMPRWKDYHDFIAYLEQVKILQQQADPRAVFNKEYLNQ